MPRELMLLLPDEVAALLEPDAARDVLGRVAATLYGERKISFGAAARLAGVAYADFFRLLARYGICLNYTEADLAEDAEVLKELFDRHGAGG